MSGKGMGSDGTYLTPEEVAQIHGVHVSQVHTWSRGGMLEAEYPLGRPGGKRFRRDAVYDLLELREDQKGGFQQKLPQLAMRAIVTSRRVEKRLNEIVDYLGLSSEQLGLSKEDVVTLHAKIGDLLEHPVKMTPEVIIHWSKTLLAVTEEYLELVALHLEEPEPWQIYMKMGRFLAEQCSPGTSARMFAEHARKNLRNVAYFYLRGAKGQRAANRIFPGETYSGRLLRTILPL